eukprot:14565568-Alexandrium_andersonii.AAC.1
MPSSEDATQLVEERSTARVRPRVLRIGGAACCRPRKHFLPCQRASTRLQRLRHSGACARMHAATRAPHARAAQ